jgi:hypothetical protein
MRLSNADRLAFAWLYRLCPAAADAITIIRPETLIRWHRRGFKAFWRWKSRSRGGRPAIPSSWGVLMQFIHDDGTYDRHRIGHRLLNHLEPNAGMHVLDIVSDVRKPPQS